MKKVVISAGGTGGHLIPAQQLADKLVKKVDPVFLAKGLSDNNNFRKEKFKYRDIASSPAKKNLSSLFSILKGTLQSILFFHKNKIDIVVGFGSYHTFPVLLAAFLCRKKIVVFESNTIFGKVNSLFLKKAKIVAVQFPMEGKLLKNFVYVPTLPWIEKKGEDKKEARKHFSLDDKFTVLVFGGSQGADFINKTFCDFIAKNKKDVQVIHICGSMEKANEIRKFYAENGVSAYVSSYERDMVKVYSAADLVVARSGASTLSELIFFSLPSILIPYPYAAKNHQAKNAYFMKNQVGGTEVFLEKEFDFEAFSKKMIEMIEDRNVYFSLKKNLNNFKENVKLQNRKSLDELIYNL